MTWLSEHPGEDGNSVLGKRPPRMGSHIRDPIIQSLLNRIGSFFLRGFKELQYFSYGKKMNNNNKSTVFRTEHYLILLLSLNIDFIQYFVNSRHENTADSYH